MRATLIDKIWNDHVVTTLDEDLCIVRIDRTLLHERGGGVALDALTKRSARVRRPSAVFATIDHLVDTDPARERATRVPGGEAFIDSLRAGTRQHGIRLFDIDDPEQGIVHVISPELGIALPGSTLACNDSHTCTVGGVGALGWGIGSTELAHALATQTLILARPRAMRITLRGTLSPWTGAKDVVLAVIARLGASGGKGYYVEFAGPIVMGLSVDERLTLCNMAVEFAATSAIVAPDDTTYEYLQSARFAPSGASWDAALAYFRSLPSEPDASYEREVTFELDRLAPQITWGTHPEHATSIDGRIPEPGDARGARNEIDHALRYMGLVPGALLEGTPIDAAFIGSCTNSRVDDLRAAARVLKGRRVAKGVRALCVPGSARVKRIAEDEGLAAVFVEAGFDWREPGCSLCFNAGGERFEPGHRVVTTTNRNFEHRQGHGARSHLASPATVAASAVMGAIADVRKLMSAQA